MSTNKSPYSIKFLSLAVVAALSGITSFAVSSASDDDELLMFVNLSQPNSAVKPVAPRPSVAPVARPAPVAGTPFGQAHSNAPVAEERSQPKRPPPAANWKSVPVSPLSSGALFNRPAAPSKPAAPMTSSRPITTSAPITTSRPTTTSAPIISAAPSVRSTVTPVAPAPAIRPSTAARPLFAPVEQPPRQTITAPVVTPERVSPSPAVVPSSSASSTFFREVRPQAEPALTPMPSVPSQVAAPRRQVANAPSEAEIKMLFADAVRQALRISPRISSSRSQAAAAESSVDEAKGQRWPQVDLTTNSKSLYFGSGSRNGGHKSDVPAVGINVATTLYDFGQTSNTIKTRQDQARAATVGIAAEEENTAWELSNAMIELNKQRLIISLSQDYVARMKELTSMLSGIVAVDKGRSSELTQAKGRLLSAQSSLDAAVSKARDTEIVIYRLLGDSQIALPAAAQWNMNMPVLSAQLASLDRHPTILKARADAQASLSEAAAVRSSGLPSLNWVVSKNTGEDEYGRSQAFQTGLQMSWGLFRGGSNSAAERAALARAEASRHLVDEQHRDLEQRVRAANQDAGSLLERADLYQNLKVESDRIRLAFFEQWYHLGKRTLLDVLSAESDYYNNRVNEVSSRFDGYAAIMRSHASSGQLIDWLNSSGR